MTLLLLSFFTSFNLAACSRLAPKEASEIIDKPDLKNATQFLDVSPINADSIWVVTVRGDLMLISKQAEPRKANIDAGKAVVISFIDSTNGWLADRKSRIWRTLDGGSSWQLVSTPPNEGAGFYLPQQLTFVDEFNGWLIGIFTVWRTGDGGKTWQPRFSVSNASSERVGRLYRGAFVSQESGCVTSSGGVVLHTTDGGKTWETLSAASERTDLHDITFSDEHKGWLIGRPSGGIYLTDDGGANWLQQLASPDRTYLNSVGFAGNKEGWAVGWRSTGLVEVREGVVLHTSDGGTSWSEKDVGKKERFFDRVTFYDNRHGWLVGRDQIYYTEDGGASWRTVMTLPPIDEKI